MGFILLTQIMSHIKGSSYIHTHMHIIFKIQIEKKQFQEHGKLQEHIHTDRISKQLKNQMGFI